MQGVVCYVKLKAWVAIMQHFGWTPLYNTMC